MSFAFVVNVYNDQHLAKRLLEQIKTHCSCDIIVIGDGVKLEDYCKQGTIWIENERTKAQGQKGLWTQRYLKLFLELTFATHLLRVDPDTCVWRPFMLPGMGITTYLEPSPKRYKYPFVNGGCIGFTRDAAEKIVSSNLLLDDKYEEFNYLRYKFHKWEHEETSDEKLAFQDWIVGDICHRLNLKLKKWDEIQIFGGNQHIPSPGRFAITHPHPRLEKKIDMNKTIYMVSGLPRSGSTIFQNILAQNPRFFSTQTSGCLDVLFAIRNKWHQLLEHKAHPVDNKLHNVLHAAFYGYYEDVEQTVVFDKSRGWLAYIEFIESVIEKKVKVLVPIRPITDILASFEMLYRNTAKLGSRPEKQKIYFSFKR